jgi:hypothetical protein
MKRNGSNNNNLNVDNSSFSSKVSSISKPISKKLGIFESDIKNKDDISTHPSLSSSSILQLTNTENDFGSSHNVSKKKLLKSSSYFDVRNFLKITKLKT